MTRLLCTSLFSNEVGGFVKKKKRRNVEFSREVAGLIQGINGGPILGFVDRPGNNNTLWMIKNVGGGGNEIIIESVYARRTFAGAEQFPGAALSGSSEQTVWTVVKEDRGYYLQSPNARLVWQLTRDRDYAPIVLDEFTGQYNTQWTFDQV